MLAELTGQQALLDVAAVVGALTAIGVFLAAVAKLRPLRWVARKLIGEPVSEWFGERMEEQRESIIETLRTEMARNGGSSAGDTIVSYVFEEMDKRRVEDRNERVARQEALDRRLDAIEAVHRDLRPMLADWKRSHPELPFSPDDDTAQT